MKILKIAVFVSALLLGFLVVPKLEESINENAVAPPPPLEVNQFPPPPPKLEVLDIPEELTEDLEKYRFKMKLIETGEGFHGDEIDAKNGEIWLGLFREGNRYFLKDKKLKVKRVHDVVVDTEGTSEKTGKSVSAGFGNKPLFLLKNAGMLKAGEVQSLFNGLTWEEAEKLPEKESLAYEENTDLKKGFSQSYSINGNQFQLKVIEAKNKEGKNILALILEGDGKRQILHSLESEYNNSLGRLKWAGDLDRDGKPDFYLELYIHDNVEYLNLFLSTKAKKGNLIGKAAYFSTTGC